MISGTYFQYSDDENPNGLCDEAVKDDYILPGCTQPRSDMVIRLGVEEEYMNRYDDA